MNRRQKIIVSITGIFIVLLALVGLTYAYFLTRIRGNDKTESISVTTANLELVYGDGNNLVTATNIVPDQKIDVKDFTVTNKGSATVNNYKVYLENVQNQFELKKDVTYTLTCKSYKTTNIDVNFSTLAEDGTCSGASKTTFPSVMSVIASNTIEEGYTHRYELTVEYADTGQNQSVDMGKTLIAKINVYDEKIKFLAREIIDNALSEETVTYNKTAYIEPSMLGVTENTSIPASQNSLKNEKIVSYAFDDYGTSYYFRGNVEDNYVNFAGMCWRIVRIAGDGSVKLLLEDRNEQCNDKEGQDLNNNGKYFTGNWEDENRDENRYVFGYDNTTGGYRLNFLNYKGGLADSFKSFQTSLAKKIDSSIGDTPTNEQVSNTLASKLKIDEWCFDDTEIPTNSLAKHYGAYIRIYTNKKPSLSCSGRKLTEFRDATNMYVATLTVDEISFAGATGSANSNYYLMNTYARDNNLNWWSFSPHSFNGSIDLAYGLQSDGHLYIYNVVNSYVGSRPAVSLKSGSVITGGEGTLEKPYIIG